MSSLPVEHTPLEAALHEAEVQYAAANPASRARHERALRAMPEGRSRHTLYHSPFPLSFAGGRDARITDLDGHEYLNLVGDNAAGVYGHTCAPIHTAIREALNDGIALSGSNTRELELAELVSQRIPSMDRVTFCNSEGEALLFAVQLARHATQRSTLFVFEGSHHGGHLVYGFVDPQQSIPFPRILATYNDVEGTREALRAQSTELAAVLVEPVMTSGGVIPASAEFLNMLREETRRLGIVLIFDEVVTSRLAPGGVQGLRGIWPDLTTLGSFWGGGLSFGAVGGTRDIMRHLNFTRGGGVAQDGTFNDNALALSAGLVGARDVYTPEACLRLNSLGDSLRLQLNALGKSLRLGFQATGLGGVLSTHWHDRPITGPALVDPADAPLRRLFQLQMLAGGHYVTQHGMVNLSLPMNEADLKGFVGSVREYLIRNADLLPRTTVNPA